MHSSTKGVSGEAFAGGFLITVSDLEVFIEFYCKVLQWRVCATDGTSAMLGPAQAPGRARAVSAGIT